MEGRGRDSRKRCRRWQGQGDAGRSQHWDPADLGAGDEDAPRIRAKECHAKDGFARHKARLCTGFTHVTSKVEPRDNRPPNESQSALVQPPPYSYVGKVYGEMVDVNDDV